MPWSWGIEPFTIHFDLDGRHFQTRYFPSQVDTVGQRIFWTGLREWEKDTVPVFLRLLRESHCFMDIGANCGIYTVLACAVNPAIRVVALEPVPAVYAALENNVRANGLAPRVHLLQVAASTAEGVAQFHHSEDPTMGSLSTTGYRGKAGRLIDVRTSTLDCIAAGLPTPPDLIKIDVEGFEDAVLSGGQHTLSANPPRIIVEANPDGPFEKLTAILGRHGYSFYHLNESGMQKQNAIRPNPDPRYECCNWLCLPPGRSAPGL